MLESSSFSYQFTVKWAFFLVYGGVSPLFCVCTRRHLCILICSNNFNFFEKTPPPIFLVPCSPHIWYSVKMKHSQIFPTDIFQWKDILTPQEFESVKNAVQFDKADVDIPLLKRFVLNTAMPELMQAKGIDPKYTVELIEMWGNVLQPGDDHQHHSHPNCVFSGIFYLTEGNPTIFCDPRPAANVLRLINPYNLNTDTKTVLFAVPNQMVMFDGWLPHYVGVNKEQSARKSISFNVIFRGEYGYKGSKANVVI